MEEFEAMRMFVKKPVMVQPEDLITIVEKHPEVFTLVESRE